ncbi:MAG: thioredoxin family protein [Opitutales bacterium]|nr:thioredoxin family protein [Opitutales bacterium]
MVSISGSNAIPLQEKAVSVDMVADHDRFHPGDSIRIGFRFDVAEPWHLYWVNPGNTGMPTEVEWELPDGFRVGELHFPDPKRYSNAGMVDYIMEGEFLIWTTLQTSNDLKPGESVAISARVSWLACNQVCIPGDKHLSVPLMVANPGEAYSASSWAVVFDSLENQKLPKVISDPIQSAIQNDLLSLRLPLKEIGDSNLVDVYFFPFEPILEPSVPQTFEKEGNYLVLNARISGIVPNSNHPISGVLELSFADGSQQSITLKDVGLTETNSSLGEESPTSLFLFIALAFAGGLILNLMPCVFPVIGLKIMGFASRAGDSRSKIAFHGLAFTAGILLSFWILVAILQILRASGHELGWGFQLQNPVFVFFLMVLFLVFGMSLSGVFEFGTSAISLAKNQSAESGLGESFASGILATLVATPCSAPFLAPALGAAMTLPPAQSWVLFSCIAIGLALPYLILSLFPSALSRLPKPGQWMESFKQFMAYPLYGTVAFLLWSVLPHLDQTAQLDLFFSIPLLAMATWIWGRWNRPHLPRQIRTTAALIAVGVFVSGIWMGYPSNQENRWQPWSQEAVTTALKQGRPVFVDFTARWCATCQVNKRVSLASEKVLQSFHEHNVTKLRADWTKMDPVITQELLKHGKAAVPVYLVYFPDQPKPIILPELLTPQIIINTFDSHYGENRPPDVDSSDKGGI